MAQGSKVTPQVALDVLTRYVLQCSYKITQTLKLSHCWVCGPSNGEDKPLEEHHVVPRAFGGENGPTVTLCTGCHTKVHKAAKKRVKLKQVVCEAKTMYLATVVACAELVSECSNKRVGYSGAWTAQEHGKLVAIQKALNFSSQHEALVYAIGEVYKRLFGSQK